jgi:hypothetical protein
VKKQPFYFEIKDIVTQFISAFDDVVISRHNRDRSVEKQIKVRYVYAPKQRVVHDLTNKAKHITLPVIAVNISSVSRDPARVFNKILGSHHPRVDELAGYEVRNRNDFLKPPTPIDISLSMSILTRYQTDMDQILSNFIPYTNPYIVISWTTPEGLLQEQQEIRSQVLWDGSVSMTYPDSITADTQYRVAADVNFVIKGWLFRDTVDPEGQIFKVTSNFTPIIDMDSI